MFFGFSLPVDTLSAGVEMTSIELVIVGFDEIGDCVAVGEFVW